MTKIGDFEIGSRKIGFGYPVYVVAELSANWSNYEKAVSAVILAKNAGANAIKSQVFTSNSITVNKHILIEAGEWAGQSYRELYEKAAMPREWNIALADRAKRVGIDFFASVFSEEDLEWMEKFISPPMYKVSSFEIVDSPLLECVARTGKPVIVSTGMADDREIERAVQILDGKVPFALLHCNSSYPAKEDEIDIRRMQSLANYNCPVGFSDHTRGINAAIVAVAFGANIIEKHFTPDEFYTPDSFFSLGTMDFESMVDSIRTTEEMLKPRELIREGNPSFQFRPSLWVVKDMKAGDKFSPDNVKSLRPNLGMSPENYWNVIGECARTDVVAGTPLTQDLIVVDEEWEDLTTRD